MRKSIATLPLFFLFFNMINPIDQALDILYERVMEMPNKVLDIFNNFFGEERVDMQGFTSKIGLRHLILETSVKRTFRVADMESKLPRELDRSSLTDEDLASLSDENAAALVEVILSNSITEWCKQRVDNGFILVHFPRTVVTNENDKSTIVNNLYVKVPITIYGGEDGLFTMNRSEYTVAEIYSDYMHSHASCIPRSNFKTFVNCCLGSGPLKNTQSRLSIGFDEDRWNIFCLELSKYVEVESIAGRPYHYLEKVSFRPLQVLNIDRLNNTYSLYISSFNDYRQIIKNIIKEFLLYYLEHNNLIFSYRNGIYSLGMPFIEYLIHLSNSFIEYINSRSDLPNSFLSCNIIDDYTIINGKLYDVGDTVDYHIGHYRDFIGKSVCTFKGNPITIKITDIDNFNNNTENSAKIINLSVASCLLNRILRTINYRYGRNQENPNSTSGKVKYKV